MKKGVKALIIIYKDFKMTPGNAKERFDLVQIKKITVKKGQKLIPKGKKVGDVYTKEIECGYDMRLETAIESIIRLCLAEEDRTIELREYLAEYKKAKDEILNLLK